MVLKRKHLNSSFWMRFNDVIYSYFKGLETGNLSMILHVFAGNAMIHSPLYGDVPAAEFYAKLFADTRRSDITLLNVFDSTENNYTTAVHFKYHWILSDGTPTHFECVDVFKFDETGKIADMTIIYDTAKLRPAFEALSK
jgi:hypothetical protein